MPQARHLCGFSGMRVCATYRHHNDLAAPAKIEPHPEARLKRPHNCLLSYGGARYSRSHPLGTSQKPGNDSLIPGLQFSKRRAATLSAPAQYASQHHPTRLSLLRAYRSRHGAHWQKALARLGHCRHQQRRRLRHRRTHGAVRIRSRQPSLHRSLHQQPR
jgi:hypothetical protein